MARPAKSVDLSSKHLTKEERKKRKKNEEKLRVNCDNLVCSEWFNDEQKKAFSNVVEWLKPTQILSNSDVHILEEYVLTVSYLKEIGKKMNDRFENIVDSDLSSTRSKLMKDFFRLSNELCLSPQSRAKIANMLQNNDKDPLLEILKELSL